MIQNNDGLRHEYVVKCRYGLIKLGKTVDLIKFMNFQLFKIFIFFNLALLFGCP